MSVNSDKNHPYHYQYKFLSKRMINGDKRAIPALTKLYEEILLYEAAYHHVWKYAHRVEGETNEEFQNTNGGQTGRRMNPIQFTAKDMINAIKKSDSKQYINKRIQEWWDKNFKVAQTEWDCWGDRFLMYKDGRTDDDDTHHIYYAIEEIEKVEPECNHKYKSTEMTRNEWEDGRVVIAYCEVDNDYCPLCGEDLRSEIGDDYEE